MKTIFDFIVSLFSLLLLFPLFILVSILIMMDDPGSPFFTQKRVGRYGKSFSLYKFRSMKVNASELGGYSTKSNDPRITRLGRFIRRASIDELPQLINVLLGQMSIVGPRPDVPAQRDVYTEKQWEERLSVKPGITGLAQATIRSDATHEQRLNLDLEYVSNHSLSFDLKIIFMTVKQMINKGGN